MPVSALDLIDVDALHTPEELQVREVVRRLVDAKVRPRVADWSCAGWPGRW